MLQLIARVASIPPKAIGFMVSAGLATRQFVQLARHIRATLSTGLATRQFQRSFGPMGVQTARVSADVGLDKCALSGARRPACMMSAGIAARQSVQRACELAACGAPQARTRVHACMCFACMHACTRFACIFARMQA